MPLPALIPVAIGIGNVLHKTYKIGQKAYKIAKPHVGKHVSSVVSDVKRKSVASYKTFKESLLTGRNPLTHGTSSKLIYKKAPKGKMYKGKPRVNIHASRKQSMIDTRKRELLATGGRFSKESKRTGAVGLAGSALYLTSGETDTTTIKPSSGKDKTIKDLQTKNAMLEERLNAKPQPQTVDSTANTKNDAVIKNSGAVALDTTQKIGGPDPSNIVTPYHVGRDRPNQAYASLEKRVKGQVDYRAMNTSRSLLRG